MLGHCVFENNRSRKIDASVCFTAIHCIIISGYSFCLILVLVDHWAVAFQPTPSATQSTFRQLNKSSYSSGFTKMVPSVYTLLMNIIYLSHSTQVAEGIISWNIWYKKLAKYKKRILQYYINLPTATVSVVIKAAN